MNKQVYTVKQLTGELRNLLESSYRQIWVEGEISGLSAPASGHLYFSLKEHNAVIRCAYFRNRRGRSALVPEDGMQVLVSGQISLYEPRGDLQLIVSYMEEAGEGALRRAFDQLKQKLSNEGLFDESHKKLLPTYPSKIGIITSESGAALQDILTTLRRRYAAGHVILYPVLVQGETAPADIVEAITTANRRVETDVIIIARGGGSLEDLQAFNDESVARAIFGSSIPIISGVGHEVDFTITDMVADLRAATPTAAAERVAPDLSQLNDRIRSTAQRLQHGLKRKLQNDQQSLDYLTSRLIHPSQKLALFNQQRSHLQHQLRVWAGRYIAEHRYQLQHLDNTIRQHSPATRVTMHRQRLEENSRMLSNLVKQRFVAFRNTANRLHEKLDIMSPSHTLNRGYAILQNSRRDVITDPQQTVPGEKLKAKLAKGELEVSVKNPTS